MKFKRLLACIRRDEGFKSAPYLDSRGVWTIGYGFTHVRGEKVGPNTDVMWIQEAEEKLRAEVYQAIMDAQDLIANFDALNDARQEVVVNMVYNLGKKGVRNFKKTLAAIEAGDYSKAADEMIDSRWYTQVGARAYRLQWAMRTGVFLDH